MNYTSHLRLWTLWAAMAFFPALVGETLPIAPTPPHPPTAPTGRQLEETNASPRQIIQTGMPVHLETHETATDVVVFFSSASIEGEVLGDVVVIGGEARISGHVHGDVVNIGTGIHMRSGSQIDGDAVGLLGGIQISDHSTVHGDAVGILGGIQRESGARIGGQEINLAWGGWMGTNGPQIPHWFRDTITEICLKLRPLSLHVGWVWILSGIHLALYAVLTLAARGAITEILQTFNQRGATAFLMGLAALPLAALGSLTLIATGIGILVLPFLWAAMLMAALLGKTGLLQYLGLSLMRKPPRQSPSLLALGIGFLLLSLTYLIPVLGLLFWMTLTVWALGAALLTVLIRSRRECAPTPNSASTSILQAPPEPGPATECPPLQEPSTASELHPARLPESLTLPRVGLKKRLLATLIDWFIVSATIGMLPLLTFKAWFMIVYFVSMWVWKQTTLGGLLLRLKVVRLDDRPMDIGTALFRSFGALIGTAALGVGYLWCHWDPERQSWHDKIAGTVVVQVPKVQPLT